MIKATELRIGNKVKCKISNDAGIYEVLAIPAWGMDGNGDGKEPLIIIDRCPKQSVPESKLKPIKLTPEILERSGFVKDDRNWFKIGVYRIGKDDNDTYGFYEFYQGRYATIQFVHQLQNLYFSLTNKELMIDVRNDEPSVASKA